MIKHLWKSELLKSTETRIMNGTAVSTYDSYIEMKNIETVNETVGILQLPNVDEAIAIGDVQTVANSIKDVTMSEMSMPNLVNASNEIITATAADSKQYGIQAHNYPKASNIGESFAKAVTKPPKTTTTENNKN